MTLCLFCGELVDHDPEYGFRHRLPDLRHIRDGVARGVILGAWAVRTMGHDALPVFDNGTTLDRLRSAVDRRDCPYLGARCDTGDRLTPDEYANHMANRHGETVAT